MYNEVPSLFLIVFFGNLHSVSPVHYNTFGLQAPSLTDFHLPLQWFQSSLEPVPSSRYYCFCTQIPTTCHLDCPGLAVGANTALLKNFHSSDNMSPCRPSGPFDFSLMDNCGFESNMCICFTSRLCAMLVTQTEVFLHT